MQTKYLEDEQIIEQINDFLYNENIRYALLINGTWGSGKTYFIKNKVIKILEDKYKNESQKLNKKEKLKNKKPIYISLYGISSLPELKNQIISNMIKSEMFKKITPFLDFGAKIGSDLISKNYSINSSDTKITNLINKLYKIENVIIFFDDLERCNVDINIVLGYINSLVEHNSIKVILIADEEKIGRMDYEKNLELKYLVSLQSNIDYKQEPVKDILGKTLPPSNKFEVEEVKENTDLIFGKFSLYEEIKEKLIGRTIFYKPNLSDIYDVLSEEIIKSKGILKVVSDLKNTLIATMESKNYWNLRTIQFILFTFEKLASISIETKLLDKFEQKYLSDLFRYCILKSIEIKQGEYTSNWENSEEIVTETDLFNSLVNDGIKKFKFVDDYLLYSFIDNEKVKKIINDYIKIEEIEQNDPNDPIYVLKQWRIIPETEIKYLIDELSININNNKYVLDLYSDIIHTLMNVLNLGICKNEIQEIINVMEINIKTDKVNGNFKEDDFMMLSKEVLELYNKNISNIKILSNKRNEVKKEANLDEFLKLDDWGKQLKDYCHSNSHIFINERKFAPYLNVDIIGVNIKTKSIEQTYQFFYALQKIYKFSNVKEFYQNDIPYIEKLIKKLKQVKKSNKDRVKEYVLNAIIVFLEDLNKNLDL